MADVFGIMFAACFVTYYMLDMLLMLFSFMLLVCVVWMLISVFGSLVRSRLAFRQRREEKRDADVERMTSGDSPRKKIFGKSDGEYVEYEEI